MDKINTHCFSLREKQCVLILFMHLIKIKNKIKTKFYVVAISDKMLIQDKIFFIKSTTKFYIV